MEKLSNDILGHIAGFSNIPQLSNSIAITTKQKCIAIKNILDKKLSKDVILPQERYADHIYKICITDPTSENFLFIVEDVIARNVFYKPIIDYVYLCVKDSVCVFSCLTLRTLMLYNTRWYKYALDIFVKDVETTRRPKYDDEFQEWEYQPKCSFLGCDGCGECINRSKCDDPDFEYKKITPEIYVKYFRHEKWKNNYFYTFLQSTSIADHKYIYDLVLYSLHIMGDMYFNPVYTIRRGIVLSYFNKYFHEDEYIMFRNDNRFFTKIITMKLAYQKGLSHRFIENAIAELNSYYSSYEATEFIIKIYNANRYAWNIIWDEYQEDHSDRKTTCILNWFIDDLIKDKNYYILNIYSLIDNEKDLEAIKYILELSVKSPNKLKINLITLYESLTRLFINLPDYTSVTFYEKMFNFIIEPLTEHETYTSKYSLTYEDLSNLHVDMYNVFYQVKDKKIYRRLFEESGIINDLIEIGKCVD